MVWGNHKNISTQKFIHIHWENRGLQKGSLCSWLSRVLWHVGAGCCVSPYVSAISGAVAIICVSFLPFLYRPTWMSFSAATCTTWFARAIAWAGIEDESEPLDSVSPLYAPGTVIEPFLPVLSCSHDCIVYIYVHYTTRYYSLLKIFCVHMHGCSKQNLLLLLLLLLLAKKLWMFFVW